MRNMTKRQAEHMVLVLESLGWRMFNESAYDLIYTKRSTFSAWVKNYVNTYQLACNDLNKGAEDFKRAFNAALE